MNTLSLIQRVATLLLIAATAASAQIARRNIAPGLAGTSWQLVEFENREDTLRPTDRANYTVEFGTDGRVSARLDCNRGRGTWTSTRPNQLQLSPLTLTRAKCPSESLHDRIAEDWTAVRSYAIKDGHLFLSLRGDRGVYEFEPASGSKPAISEPPVDSVGPVTFRCSQPGGATDLLTATYFKTRPALVLLERGGQTRPAFGVRSASGSRYEGQNVMS